MTSSDLIYVKLEIPQEIKAKQIFKDIMDTNLYKFDEIMNLKKTSKAPDTTNMKKTAPSHIIINLLNVSYQKEIFKATRGEKYIPCVQRNRHNDDSRFHIRYNKKKKTIKQHSWGTERKKSKSKILYPMKISFKNKNKILFFI